MKRYNGIISVVLMTLIVSFWAVTSYACDLDGDGKDDVLAYQKETDNSITWRWIQSSNATAQSLTHAASPRTFPAPGYYLGKSHPAVLGHIEADNVLWKVYNASSLNQVIGFALPDLSYYPGLDVNGDGVTDLVKIFDRCGGITKSCFAKKPHGFFVFNNSDGTSTFQSITTSTRFFGRGNSPIVGLDINGDGTDDMCAGSPLKSNPSKFKFTCKDIQTNEVLKTFTVARLYNQPMGLKRDGKAALFASWEKVGSKIKFTYLNDKGSAKTASVRATGRIVTGDYLGRGYQQVLMKGSGTTGTIFDLFTKERTALTGLPEGRVMSCSNNLEGSNEKPLNSTTAKKVL